jgi:hypothetical protein
MAEFTDINPTEEHKRNQNIETEKQSAYTSNGFYLRHVDMNLANRVCELPTAEVVGF